MSRLRSTQRWLLLMVAGLASFFLAMQWGRRDARPADEVVEAVTRHREPVVRNGTSAAPEVAREAMPVGVDRSRSVPATKGNAFAVLNWQPPPAPVRAVAPPPPPPPPPAAPVAPPLPFSFVGLLEKGGARPQAFLAKGESLLVVGVGDVIDNNTYRVDSLAPQQVVLTYLPLNTVQTLQTTGGAR